MPASGLGARLRPGAFRVLFTRIIDVTDVGKYKPALEAYHRLAREVGRSEAQMRELWPVSSNLPYIVRAKNVGMKAAWVVRAGKGWPDRLLTGPDGRTTVGGNNLAGVIRRICGKKFSKNLRPLDADGNEQGMWGEAREKAEEESEEEEEDESSEESSSEETDKPQLSREERRAAAKAKKEAALARKAAKAAAPGDLPPSSEEGSSDSDSDVAPANPNHTKSARNQASAAPIDPAAAATPTKPGSGKTLPLSQLSRREREALQAQQAKERYQKLHAEGKTDEARADLARLAIIKEKREAEAARKKAEKEERDEADRERKREIDEKEQRKRDAAMGAGGKKGGGKKKA
ncbi:MAG: hypothetical protein M1832_005586 [Thelocarpon impressellum]|nr:MAG: hypothetical protein M1832_005586 [Thelocarpon impressellum]